MDGLDGETDIQSSPPVLKIHLRRGENVSGLSPVSADVGPLGNLEVPPQPEEFESGFNQYETNGGAPIVQNEVCNMSSTLFLAMLNSCKPRVELLLLSP
jgi:hypothetical protein